MTFFECFADKSLLRQLGLSSKELKGGHSFGRSKVCSRLKNASDSLGLVDEDPGAARDPYLKHLFTLSPIYEDNNLFCSMDSKRNNKLIVLKPDLETLILRIASEMRIDLNKKYRLPTDRKSLHSVLTNIQKREKFNELLMATAEHKTVEKLKQLIKD